MHTAKSGQQSQEVGGSYPHWLPIGVTPGPENLSKGPNGTPSTSTEKLSLGSQESMAMTFMSRRRMVWGGRSWATRDTLKS